MAMQGLKTVTQLDKAIKETTKTTPYSIAGYSGLFLSVEVSKYTGKKTAIFKHRYSHPILKGKRPTITLGQYPTFTLEQARQAYNDNLALLGRDIDPIEHRQDEKQREIADRKNTLQIFIDEWLSDLKVNNVNQKTLKNYTEWLSPIQSQFSQTRVTDIKPSDVIQFIKAIQKTHPAKGLRVKSVFKSVLQIAKAHGIIEYNPADNLKGTLITHTPKHQNAIITLTDLNKLLNDIALLPESPLFQKEILQLLALTFVRINDLCAMKWSDIDMTAKTWTFEPQKGVDRSDMVDSLIIPLAPQAIAILESMKAKTGGHEYVFYNGRRKEQKHTHKQEINKILNSPAMNDGLGYKGIHSPHGFRATARTMLEERLDFDYRLIEMQLGHNVRDSNRRAYNRVKWLNQRTQMMNKWANYLDDLRAGKIDNVIYLDKIKAKAMNE